MNPDVVAHLLTQAIARRVEIARALELARRALPAGSPGIGSLESERRLNEQAIAELEQQLRSAA